MVLQSNIGSEFIAEIAEKLMEIWLEAKIEDSSWLQLPPTVPRLCGRANQGNETMLSMWLQDNNTNNWGLGLNFVRLGKNTRHHSGIDNDPYTVMYWQQCQLGVCSLSLRAEAIASIGSELQ
jgi:hypothetical protein